MQKPRIKLKIANGIWLCYDDHIEGRGKTPPQAWYEYKKKIIDNVIKDVYNYETSMG